MKTAGRVFECVVLAAVGVNAGVVVADSVIDGHDEVFETVHRVILALFVVELVARLRAGGWRYLRRPWHAFDAAVIVLSVLPVFGLDAALLRLCRLARLIHLGRHLSGLRIITKPTLLKLPRTDCGRDSKLIGRPWVPARRGFGHPNHAAKTAPSVRGVRWKCRQRPTAAQRQCQRGAHG